MVTSIGYWCRGLERINYFYLTNRLYHPRLYTFYCLAKAASQNGRDGWVIVFIYQFPKIDISILLPLYSKYT